MLLTTRRWDDGTGPTSLHALRAVLSETRQRGHAIEDGDVTPAFASVAAAVRDHSGHPVGAVATTFESRVSPTGIIDATLQTAATLTRRLSGRVTSKRLAR